MNGVTRAGIVLVFAALLAVAGSWHYWLNAMAEMKAESAAAHAKMEAALTECHAAIAAAGQALKAREIVNEKYLARLDELSKALGGADDMPLPDSLREFLAKDAASSARPYGSDSNPSQN